MPNPWDRQPRESVWLPEGVELSCPVCARTTDSLKQYRYISRVLCYLLDFSYQTTYYRACPACMRSLIARRIARSIIPGNVVWLLLVLPWGLGLIVASFRKGHSQDVIRQITPEIATAAADAAANEFSWGRVWVIVAVLFCWVPLFGLVLAAFAYLTNRKSADWKRTASIAALTVSGLIHLAIAVLIAVNAK